MLRTRALRLAAAINIIDGFNRLASLRVLVMVSAIAMSGCSWATLIVMIH